MPIEVRSDSTGAIGAIAQFGSGLVRRQRDVGQAQFENMQRQIGMDQRQEVIGQGDRRLDLMEQDQQQEFDRQGLAEGSLVYAEGDLDRLREARLTYAEIASAVDMEDDERETALGEAREAMTRIRPIPAGPDQRKATPQEQFESRKFTGTGGAQMFLDEKNQPQFTPQYERLLEQRDTAFEAIMKQKNEETGKFPTVKAAMAQVDESFPLQGGATAGATLPTPGAAAQSSAAPTLSTGATLSSDDDFDAAMREGRPVEAGQGKKAPAAKDRPFADDPELDARYAGATPKQPVAQRKPKFAEDEPTPANLRTSIDKIHVATEQAEALLGGRRFQALSPENQSRYRQLEKTIEYEESRLDRFKGIAEPDEEDFQPRGGKQATPNPFAGKDVGLSATQVSDGPFKVYRVNEMDAKESTYQIKRRFLKEKRSLEKQIDALIADRSQSGAVLYKGVRYKSEAARKKAIKLQAKWNIANRGLTGK